MPDYLFNMSEPGELVEIHALGSAPVLNPSEVGIPEMHYVALTSLKLSLCERCHERREPGPAHHCVLIQESQQLTFGLVGRKVVPSGKSMVRSERDCPNARE